HSRPPPRALWLGSHLIWAEGRPLRLRTLLAPRGADRGSCFDGDCRLWVADGLDAAICAEAARVRSRHCVGALRGDIGRCHGVGDLLFRRLRGVAWDAPLRRSACSLRAPLKRLPIATTSTLFARNKARSPKKDTPA